MAWSLLISGVRIFFDKFPSNKQTEHSNFDKVSLVKSIDFHDRIGSDHHSSNPSVRKVPIYCRHILSQMVAI